MKIKGAGAVFRPGSLAAKSSMNKALMAADLT